MNPFLRYFFGGLLLLAAACDGQSEALPTQMSLDAISTNSAATTAAEAVVAANAAATSVALVALNQPTALPPTWTASAPPTEPPTQVVVPSTTPVPSDSGTIYYIFNGDSIALLTADGLHEELILVGGAPADLTLSPDGQFLAYVADGANGTREVYITTLDGSVVQAVSCAGLAKVRLPAWSVDSSRLAFAGSESVNGALGIYTTGIAGSRQCPTGNGQRLLSATAITTLSSLTWSGDGKYVLFSSDSIYGVDVGTGTLFPPLTRPYGFGPDFNVVRRPDNNNVYYLKTDQDDQTGAKVGVLSQFDPATIGDSFPLQELPGTRLAANWMRFSRDGRYLVASSNSGSVSVQDMRQGTASTVALGSQFPPQAVPSPDGELVAYLNAGSDDSSVAQIWLVGRDGKDAKQLTSHNEGTISDLNWGGNTG
ncbi:MAG: hypothetical protein R3E39_20700 [Anaerolineae bacterium]